MIYIVYAGQWAYSWVDIFPNSKSPQGPLPTTVTVLWFCICLDRISAGAAQHQYKHSAGDGEVLFEMQQLVSIGEICVKQNRGCEAK